MAFDVPNLHPDQPAYVQAYQASEKTRVPLSDNHRGVRESDKRRDDDGAPAPPPVSNFSSSAAITSNVSFDVHTALTGKVDFAYASPGHRHVRNIPPAAPQRAEQTESRDNAALKQEAHRLALEIREHRQHKLLIEAGLVEGDAAAIEEIDSRIEAYESRLREIAGASPVISAVVRKKALPLTEVTGEYASIEKILARKRVLEEKSYRTPHERQKRHIEKRIQQIATELTAIFMAITQGQETAGNENGRENPHKREKRLGKTARIMAGIRHALRLVSRKWERIDASQEASKLRHSLRDLSMEREVLQKTQRVRVAHSKKETDQREVARRQKACPEYWQDGEDVEGAFVSDEAEEEKIIEMLDDAWMQEDFDRYEEEYQAELAEYEEAEAELAAYCEQVLGTEDGDTLEWPDDDEAELLTGGA